MKTIALLTDFGLKDNFVGVMKAVLLAINPALNLIDITHEVESCNIMEAAFLLKSSFHFFPKGTVFLVVVDPGVGSERNAIAIKTRNFYFVGPDNGALSLAARSDSISKVVSITCKKFFLKKVSSTFHGRDIFAPCASYISKGVPLNKLGNDLNKIVDIKLPQPVIENNRLRGEVIFIDKFGNLVTNITKDIFLKFVRKRKFSLHIKSRKINLIHRCYEEAKEGVLFLCEGSFGFLELSLKNKSASHFIKARVKDRLYIETLKV